MNKLFAMMLAASMAFSTVSPALAQSNTSLIMYKNAESTELKDGVFSIDFNGDSLTVNNDALEMSATVDANSNEQKWVLQKQDGGKYAIISLNTGLCLGISNDDISRATIKLDAFQGDKTQMWSIVSTSNGYEMVPATSKDYAFQYTEEKGAHLIKRDEEDASFKFEFIRKVAKEADIESAIESISVDKKANEKGRFKAIVRGTESNAVVSAVTFEVIPPSGEKKARKYVFAPDGYGDVEATLTARHFAFEPGTYTVKCGLLLDGVCESEIETYKVECDDVLQNLVAKCEKYIKENQPEAHDWQFYLRDADWGGEVSYQVDQQQSASLIKIFVMGAAYEHYDEICEKYTKDLVDTQLWNVITVSWDSAWMNLVNYLGDGDYDKGYEVVTKWANDNGYKDVDTQNIPGHNFCSTKDASQLFLDLYNHKYKHSDDMLYLLEHQTYRHKIPAGVPYWVKTGNKTGDIPTTENDTAIIYAPGGTYILSCMCTGLGDRYTARCTHRAISIYTWEFLED